MGNKNANGRIVALDYFRGVTMVAIVVNHFMVFATPLIYLTGKGQLWSGAAEMFFLMSGITFAIVRAKYVKASIVATIQKSWSRAALIYVVHCLVVLASLMLASFALSRGLAVALPSDPINLSVPGVAKTMLLQFSYGWADFLRFYVPLLLIAPFALKLLYSKAWTIVPVLSIIVFILSGTVAITTSPYHYFFIWQAYFFVGMSLARWRLPLLMWFYGLRHLSRAVLSGATVGMTGVALVISVLSTFKLDFVRSLASADGLSLIITAPAEALLRYQSTINHLLQNNRSGQLRLLVALLVLASGYILYQRFKRALTAVTGWFIIPLGRNSLDVFVAQALLIPLISLLPLPRQVRWVSYVANAVLFSLLYAVAQRRRIVASMRQLYLEGIMGWSMLRQARREEAVEQPTLPA